jgi:hypothetical protein
LALGQEVLRVLPEPVQAVHLTKRRQVAWMAVSLEFQTPGQLKMHQTTPTQASLPRS